MVHLTTSCSGPEYGCLCIAGNWYRRQHRSYICHPGSATADPLTFTLAVSGINALRDTLGGTSGTGASVEQPLFRSVTDVGTYTATTGPELFVADSTGVAFGRTPTQVRCLACLKFNYTQQQSCNPYDNGLHAASLC